MDWRRGGWTGSINRYVARDIREHMQGNAAVRLSRHPPLTRILRAIFLKRSVRYWLVVYTLFAGLLATLEYVLAHLQIVPPTWASTSPIRSVSDVSDNLLTVQVGVLGLLTLAIALVTIIAQREDSATDVHLYYYESLALEVLASNIALLVVLCIQLFWPLEFLLQLLGVGTYTQFFQLIAVSFHTLWLTLNLVALSHFVATTFSFVQRSQRELARERYVVSILPDQLTDKLRRALYMAANGHLVSNDENDSTAWFGSFSLHAEHIELERSFRHSATLFDVRMLWVKWAVRRWLRRCESAERLLQPERRSNWLRDRPMLLFPIELDRSVGGSVVICRRKGNIPLNRLERLIIGHAFRFKRGNGAE